MFADLRNESGFQFCDEGIGNLLSNRYLIDVDADLSGVEELEEGYLARGIL